MCLYWFKTNNLEKKHSLDYKQVNSPFQTQKGSISTNKNKNKQLSQTHQKRIKKTIMKKQLLLGLVLVCTQALFATTWTVNNNAGSIAQFSLLQDAIDAASSGDSLLIKGAGASYGEIDLAKRLVFIGEGYVNSGLAKSTEISKVHFASTEASGSIFRNLYMSNGFARKTGFTGDVDNIRLLRVQNYLDLTILGYNWTIVDSILTTYPYAHGITITGDYGLTVYNSKLDTPVSTSTVIGSSSIVFENCVITSTKNIKDAILRNCILIEAQTGTDNIYSNCIFQALTETSFLASQNNSQTASLFESAPLLDANFQPEEGFSPALDAGTDGTDIGVTGGKYPIKTFNGENNLPHMTSNIMKTAIIKPGEALIFEFSAKQKDNLDGQ